jgi:hypothetical protein
MIFVPLELPETDKNGVFVLSEEGEAVPSGRRTYIRVDQIASVTDGRTPGTVVLTLLTTDVHQYRADCQASETVSVCPPPGAEWEDAAELAFWLQGHL